MLGRLSLDKKTDFLKAIFFAGQTISVKENEHKEMCKVINKTKNFLRTSKQIILKE